MKNRILLIAAAALAVLYWIIIIFRLPVFTIVPGYFWHFMHFMKKPPGSPWLYMPLTLIAALGLYLVYKFRERKAPAIIILILLGYVLQIGTGFLDGHGINAFRSRLLSFGHAEFVKLASADLDTKLIVTNYEDILTDNPQIKFAHTKPPGQLLFYVLSQRITETISPSASYTPRAVKLTLFISLVWPLLAFLVIWPMYSVARALYDHRTALMAATLYLFVPSVMLVILHLDQVLYPLLFMLAISMALKAGQKSSYIWAGLCGVFVYLAAYVSFSLIVAWPVAAGLMTAVSKRRFWWKGILLSIVGAAVMYWLFYSAFNYSALTRFENAMAYHRAWKAWQPGLSNAFEFGVLNLIEFFCWVGLPIAVLFLVSAWDSVKDVLAKRFKNIRWPVIISVLALGGIALFGETKGEVGRLWIFMIPLVCIIAASEIVRRFSRTSDRTFLYIVTLQFITVMLIKHFQDFW